MKRDRDRVRRLCEVGGWWTETRPAGHAMDAMATIKRAQRGDQRTPWRDSWSETFEDIMRTPPKK